MMEQNLNRDEIESIFRNRMAEIREALGEAGSLRGLSQVERHFALIVLDALEEQVYIHDLFEELMDERGSRKPAKKRGAIEKVITMPAPVSVVMLPKSDEGECSGIDALRDVLCKRLPGKELVEVNAEIEARLDAMREWKKRQSGVLLSDDQFRDVIRKTISTLPAGDPERAFVNNVVIAMTGRAPISHIAFTLQGFYSRASGTKPDASRDPWPERLRENFSEVLGCPPLASRPADIINAPHELHLELIVTGIIRTVHHIRKLETEEGIPDLVSILLTGLGAALRSGGPD